MELQQRRSHRLPLLFYGGLVNAVLIEKVAATYERSFAFQDSPKLTYSNSSTLTLIITTKIA